jgi:hypothetical protein
MIPEKVMLFVIMAILLSIGFFCVIYVVYVLMTGSPNQERPDVASPQQAAMYPDSVTPSTGSTAWTIAKPIIGFILFVGALVGCVYIRWEMAENTVMKPTVAPNQFQPVGKITKQTPPPNFAPQDK